MKRSKMIWTDVDEEGMLLCVVAEYCWLADAGPRKAAGKKVGRKKLEGKEEEEESGRSKPCILASG